MQGAAFLTKADLMSAADCSGLATRAGAIYGEGLDYSAGYSDTSNVCRIHA